MERSVDVDCATLKTSRVIVKNLPKYATTDQRSQAGKYKVSSFIGEDKDKD